jgi:hypothetical protein
MGLFVSNYFFAFISFFGGGSLLGHKTKEIHDRIDVNEFSKIYFDMKNKIRI